MRRALIIVNPTAGAGRPLDVAEDARRFLEQAGWEVRTLATARAGHAEELAREHSAGFDRVVVAGGDGTLRETVVGLPSATLPVALIPIGKANVVARDLGIPRTPDAAIRALTSERVLPIDVGRVGDSIFLAMVGVGYDGWVTAGVSWMRGTGPGAWLYRHGGSSLVYFLAGVPSLLRLFPCRPRVTVDGERIAGRFPLLVISNTETYALGWSMTPGADPHDGKLDHQLNRGSAPWFVLGTLAAAILRRPVPGWLALHGRGRRYSVRADTPFRWQVDGDPMPPTRALSIEIVPGYARMVIPERNS
jgi:diacylglycerol kinase family enzyme